MSKLLEDYGKKIAKEERTKNIIALLNKGISAEFIHEALEVPLEFVQELENKST